MILNALLPLFLLSAAPEPGSGKWTRMVNEGKDLYATIHTNMGDISAKLYTKDAPHTVANFVGLATGEKEWTHPTTGQKEHGPLYKNVLFHRVIPGFMIQGGDPTGTGRGTPGYEFDDEIKPNLKFDKPGLLAMANRGPNTNGSQFFVTVSTPSYLNGHYSIFGEVVFGYDTAVKISEVARAAADKPVKDVVITSIDISDKPPKGVAAPAAAGTKAPAEKKKKTQ